MHLENKMTEAELLSKDQRSDFPRVSSYCLAEGFKLETIKAFVTDTHSAYNKTYDECLYICYEYHAKCILFGDYRKDRARVLRYMSKTKDQLSSLQEDQDPMGHSSASMPVVSSGQHSTPTAVSQSRRPANNPYNNTFGSLMDGKSLEEIPVWMLRGEVFLFDYGVIVLWNFTKHEEERFVEAMAPFAVRPIKEEDRELEDLHYQYEGEPRPVLI